MEDEDDDLMMLNSIFSNEAEAVEEEDEDLTMLNGIFSTEVPPPISNDISFDDWNNKGEGVFDSVEEDLEDKLAAKYPNLTFDTPIMKGGYIHDELDATNEDGEVFRWRMNTDYNASRSGANIPSGIPSDAQDREAQSRNDYINFLEFANKSKFNKKGEYKNSNDVRTLGPDYMVKNDKGQDVEMQVTPGLTKKATQIMRSNPQVTSMEEAIDIAVDTEFGQMNIAWQQNLQNNKAKENFDYQSEVKSLMPEFNPNISGDAAGDMSSADLNKTIKTLEKLGMPKEVVSTARAQAESSQGFLDYLASGSSNSFVGNAGDPGITRPSAVAARGVESSNQEIRNNIREWLDGSQEWGPNTKGKQVMTAYNDYVNEESEREENNKEIEDVKEKGLDQELVSKIQKDILNREGNTLTKEEAKIKAEENAIALTVQDNRTKRAKEDGARILEAELPFYKSKDELKALISEKQAIDKMETGDEKTLAYKKYNEKLQDFLNDDEISLLREDGKFVRKDRQSQVDALNLKNQNKKNDLKDLLIEAPDKLDEKLLDVDRELLNIAKDLKRKGLSETMNEGTYMQLFGALGQELVGAEGSVFEDFRKINNWVETGKMPSLLTPLPQSDQDSFLVEKEASGKDNLPSRWNDLLDYRSTLLLAQSLNADPTTFESTVGDGFAAGVGRFFQGFNEAIPEAIGMNASLTEDKKRELGFDIIEDVYGVKQTDSDARDLAAIEHDLWKNSGKSIPGLIRMGAEIYLTSLATGGMGLGPAALRAATFRGLLKTGMSKGVAKNVALYTSAVMTEYIGLQGSNAMEKGLGFGPGIENPELFALTASAIRLKGAQASNKFNKAILKTYENGSAAQRNALEYFYQVPTTASTKSGALKYTGTVVDRSLKSASRLSVAAGGKVVGAGTGALTISTADNVGAVLAGDKTVAQALNDVTDPAHLMELGGALLFLGLSRPDRYSKQTVERFRTEIDLLRGNNPQWNKLRRSLGMKTVSDGSKEYKEGEEAFSNRVDEALEAKKKEINESNKNESQKKQEISNLEFNANRLKLKIPLDVLAKDLANPEVMGSFKELEQAAYAISIGGFNAKNLAVIEGASFTSDGTSGFKMLELYGLEPKQAQQVVDFSYSMRDIASRRFQGDLNNPNFQKYIDESIAESRLEGAKEKLKKDYEANRLDKADYETQIKEIDSKLDIALKTKKDLIEQAKIERTGKELKQIEEYKEAGFDIREMNDAEMKKFMEENGGNFSATGFGYQGVVNGKSIALVNTDATARESVGGTATHEIWHHPFERRIGDETIEARARVIAKDTRDIEGARKQAEQEARDYLDNFIGTLKDKGILDIVATEMAKRPGFKNAVLDQIISGKEVPMFELKEFLNEFIQLNENGAFNNLKSEAQRKASEKQSTKDLTEKEYLDALNNPIKFVDFVLSGKYNSKNINEFLKREADALGAESTTTKLKASEKTSDVNELALAYESEGGNELWKTFGADEAIKQIKEKDSEGLGMLDRLIASKYKGGSAPEGFVDKVYAELVPHIRNYKPERQNENGLFGWINPQIGNKATAVYNREYKKSEIDQKSKRLSDKVDKEGNREFDVADEGAREAVESAGEGKSTETIKETKIIDPTKDYKVVKEYKGEKPLEEFVDIDPSDVNIDRASGQKGIQEKYGNVIAAELFFNKGNTPLSGARLDEALGKLTDIEYKNGKPVMVDNGKGKMIPKRSSQNLTYAKDYVDAGRKFEAGKIQEAFKDLETTRKFLKNLTGNTALEQTEIRYEKDGKEIIEKPDVSKDVRGNSVGTNNNLIKFLMDPVTKVNKAGKTVPKRSSGLSSQTPMYKPKAKYKNPSDATVKEFQEWLGITEAGKLNKYDRTIGQNLKGVAKLLGGQTANTIYTRKVKGFDKAGTLRSSTPTPKLLADLRSGVNKFQASEKSASDKKAKEAKEKEIKRIAKKIKSSSFTGEMQGMASWIKGFAKDMDIAIPKEIGADGNVRDLIGQQRLSDFASKVLSKYFGESILSGQTWSNTKLGKGMWFSTDFRNKVLKEFRKEQKDKIPLTTKEYNALKLLMGSPGLDPMKTNPFGGKQSSKWIDKVNTNYKGLDLFIDQTFKMLKENPEYLGEFLAMMKGSSSSNSHFWRNASQVIGKHKNWADKAMINPKKKGVGVGEHALVQNQAGEFMTKAILESIARDNPKAKNIAKKLLNENYFQILISHGLDGKLTQIGLQSSMPKGFWESWNKALETGNINEAWSVWSRYFNEKINKIKGADGEFGFDPNKIDLLNKRTGKVESLADVLKIGEKEFGKDVLNPEIIAKQQELIQKWSTRQEGFTKPEQLREKLAIELDMLNAKRDATLKTMKDIAEIKDPIFNMSERMPNKTLVDEANKFDKALANARRIKKEVKKARVFDFDDTIARTNSKVFAERAGERIELTAEEFAARGDELIAEGYKMDFTDFNRVVEGKKGPLFELMKKMKEAAGDRDMFILTARAPESAPAIKEFLDAMGINIPLENITGLGNSAGKAKADWLVGKAAEGYNDFYFADDAPQNVKAVRDALEVLDVKSQTQQARMNASEKLSEDFNKILEEKTGIGAEKVFSDVKSEIRGNKARKQKFFIPPSAEDFLGLLYATLPKGKKGEAALDFYQKNLFDPYTRATDNLSTDRVNLMADFKELKKELDVPKDLRKETKSGFTNEQAVRAYLWAKTGKEIPGLSKSDFKELNEIVEGDAKLKSFADQILSITKGDGYSTPKQYWATGTITTDLIDVLNTTKRKKYLEPWKQNVDVIFSKDNMNKLEAAYGKKYREAMENILKRMETGSNRSGGSNRLSNQVLNYVNQSTGVTMFLNTRSALLQTISAANFVNWSFNNPLRAGKAFANQPQYWKDFTKLINSDYLKDRRNGLKLNISESEIADAAKTSKNKAKAALNYILEKGYTPTKFADSFAIASGGAMFYRNRINDLVKKGYSVSEAEAAAMKEFRQVSEKSQQSSDPSKISAQQSGDLGRLVLQYANTPMQYARIQKRAVQDLANGRGSNKENLSKIAYYGFVQNLMFNALQQGLFALGFGDDFSDEEKEGKTIDTVNGMVDSMLRGLGMGGITVQVLKNLGLDIYKRSKKDRPEYSDAYYKLLEFSPAIKSKLSRFKSAAYPFDSKKRRAEVFDKGFSLDNPAYESMAKVISATTNLPLDRLYSKINNLKDATADDIETWQAVANVLGWPTWQMESKSKKNNKTKKTSNKPSLIFNKNNISFEDEDDGLFTDTTFE